MARVAPLFGHNPPPEVVAEQHIHILEESKDEIYLRVRSCWAIPTLGNEADISRIKRFLGCPHHHVLPQYRGELSSTCAKLQYLYGVRRSLTRTPGCLMLKSYVPLKFWRYWAVDVDIYVVCRFETSMNMLYLGCYP